MVPSPLWNDFIIHGLQFWGYHHLSVQCKRYQDRNRKSDLIRFRIRLRIFKNVFASCNLLGLNHSIAKNSKYQKNYRKYVWELPQYVIFYAGSITVLIVAVNLALFYPRSILFPSMNCKRCDSQLPEYYFFLSVFQWCYLI